MGVGDILTGARRRMCRATLAQPGPDGALHPGYSAITDVPARDPMLGPVATEHSALQSPPRTQGEARATAETQPAATTTTSKTMPAPAVTEQAVLPPQQPQEPRFWCGPTPDVAERVQVEQTRD